MEGQRRFHCDFFNGAPGTYPLVAAINTEIARSMTSKQVFVKYLAKTRAWLKQQLACYCNLANFSCENIIEFIHCTH